MPASTRRALGAVVAVMGVVVVVLGAWIVVKLGPSGEVLFSATSKSPGTLVVPSEVLNVVDVPARVTATRRHGGPVSLTVASSTDARAILASSAITSVSAVHYPSGTLDLRTSGSGSLADLKTADIWRFAVQEPGSASLVVEQSRAPETVVVTSGDNTALTDVTVTLIWQDRAWFFEALAIAMLGAVLASFSINDLWQGRATAGPGDVLEAKTSEVTS
ncbi:MAG TPA: hypothetical protein VIJ15_13035 [Dermatophilaceae bacterium]